MSIINSHFKTDTTIGIFGCLETLLGPLRFQGPSGIDPNYRPTEDDAYRLTGHALTPESLPQHIAKVGCWGSIPLMGGDAFSLTTVRFVHCFLTAVGLF